MAKVEKEKVAKEKVAKVCKACGGVGFDEVKERSCEVCEGKGK